MKSKKPQEDKETLTFLEAFSRGELEPLADTKQWKAGLSKAAVKHMKKNERINIRLQHTVLEQLKRIAIEEGLPYQTFIASVLYKYVHGRLVLPK